MSAVLQPSLARAARFMPLQAATLDAVLDIEQRAYAHPWSRGNFQDALRSGYHARVLLGGRQMLGYYIAMQGVGEAHLLNITVAPEQQQRGWGRLMLDALALWARSSGAQWLWLEVRVNNQRAIKIYENHGYRRVGLRKHYYPAGQGQREDALVMSRQL